MRPRKCDGHYWNRKNGDASGDDKREFEEFSQTGLVGVRTAEKTMSAALYSAGDFVSR